MRVAIALGGNALLRRGQRANAPAQRENVAVAVGSIAEVARGHDVVVTHGNGPQVGLLALQSEAYAGVDPYPLDVLGAESEGMIGYVLEQELMNVLPDRRIATLLTQIEVDRGDPALAHPSKPIGPVYKRATAEILSGTRGWTIAPDRGGMRRVVARRSRGRSSNSRRSASWLTTASSSSAPGAAASPSSPTAAA